MLYIEPESKDAAFHFSVEEYIVMNYPWDEPVMMIWQTDKCAMLGSNQIADAEINISFAKQEDIQLTRRSSGGGTIYTDSGTLLFTFIQPHSIGELHMDTVRDSVAAPVVLALNELGVPAKIEGRNDILVDGKKVSGLAQYVRNGRICTHGSLLFDTDLEMLVSVLNVDDEKIRSKALRSVRSRVTNIKEYIDRPYSTKEFWEFLKQSMFFNQHIRKHMPSKQDLSEIDVIFHNKYGNPSWTYGQSPKFSLNNSKRFSGGKVDVYLDIDNGVVSSCSIRGDFLGVIPIDGLEKVFENQLFRYDTIAKALDMVPLQPYLGNITSDELLSCFF